MIVKDEALLDEFRSGGPCEWCKRWAEPRQPHHLFARGHGGGNRLDVRINLAALCHECHRAHHDGHRPLRCDLLAVVAAREGLIQNEIEAEIMQLRRQPKIQR